MKRKEKENALLARARAELQKTDQSIMASKVKDNIYDKIEKKLNEDIALHNDLKKVDVEPSKELSDRIITREDALKDLQAELRANTTEIHGDLDAAKAAITELRKVNPKKANELENSLSLKIEGKKRSPKERLE